MTAPQSQDTDGTGIYVTDREIAWAYHGQKLAAIPFEFKDGAATADIAQLKEWMLSECPPRKLQAKLGGDELPEADLIPPWAKELAQQDAKLAIAAITKEGLDLIREFEGLKLTSYHCGVLWTIGYGHTSGITPGMKITEAKANEYLREDLKKFSKSVGAIVERQLTPAEKAALTSFAFNCGAGSLRSSTMLKRLNNNPEQHTGQILDEEMPRWCRSNGKELLGLKIRRLCEADLANGRDWRQTKKKLQSQ